LIHSRKVFPPFWPFLFGFALGQLAFGLAQNKTQGENKSKVPTHKSKDLSIPQGKYISFFFLKLKGQTLNIYKKIHMGSGFSSNEETERD
jgi:hypothetical protein